MTKLFSEKQEGRVTKFLEEAGEPKTLQQIQQFLDTSEAMTRDVMRGLTMVCCENDTLIERVADRPAMYRAVGNRVKLQVQRLEYGIRAEREEFKMIQAQHEVTLLALTEEFKMIQAQHEVTLLALTEERDDLLKFKQKFMLLANEA